MSYSGQIYVPPANTSFTNLTPSNTTLTTQAAGSNTCAVIASTASGDHLVGQYVAAPATPYCTIFSIAFNPKDLYMNDNISTCIFGGGFYDGTKAVTAYAVCNISDVAGVDVYYWSTTSNISATLAGNRFTNASVATGQVNWFQLRDDGTTIYFYWALDGEGAPPTHWTLLYSEARTSHLSAPTYVGWFGDANANSSSGLYYYTIQSWQTVAL